MGLFDRLRGLFGGEDDEPEVGPAGHAGSGSNAGGGDGVDEMIRDAPDLDADDGVDAPAGDPAGGGATADESGDAPGAAPGASASGGPGAGGDDLQPPESFREEAEELAEFWGDHGLDFTPESLQRVDGLVDAQWEDDRFRNLETAEDGLSTDELVFEGLVVQLGSYFGETLVRTHEGAEWRNDDEFGWVVAVDGPDGELMSNVFHVAKDCLREPSKFAVSYDEVVAHSGVGEPIIEDRGGAVTIEVSVPDGDADPDEFRAAGESVVEDYPWYDLDYSPGSLGDLDDLVTEEVFDGEHLVDEFDAEELSETVERLGGYFGETIVRSADGEWVYEDGSWTVDVEREGEVVGVDVFRGAMSVLHEGASFEGIYDRVAGALAGQYDAYDLDFTAASLARLDRLAQEEFGELAATEEATEQLLEAAAPFSAYFGEVLRREHDAVWVDRDGEAVGVDAIETAATCLAGNATFAGTYEDLLAAV